MGALERFSYPSIAALLAESSELLVLLEYESYGDRLDEKEQLEEMRRNAEAQGA